MVPWILSLLMLLAQPDTDVSTLPETAQAIDIAAHEHPLHEDPAETAAILVAIARYESRFNPRAVGYDGYGESWGLYQIHETNLKRLGLRDYAEVCDPVEGSRAAIVLIDESFRVCRRNQPLERLAMYASGRAQCAVPDGVQASRVRMRLARELLERHPPRWVEREEVFAVR